MAPSVADKNSKIAAEPPLKRKSTDDEFSDDDEEDEIMVPTMSASAAARARGSGAELVPSTKPGEPMVTKRTLQNRKAQREFRKRREARVRDLEERCRRFDQMGLEANSELHRVARRLREENEALRGLVVRTGFGHLIQSTLDSIPADGFGPSGGYGPDQSFSATSGPPPSASGMAGPPPNATEQFMPPPPPGSVNPNMLDPNGAPNFGSHNAGMNLRWSDDQAIQSGSFQNQQQPQQHQGSPWAPNDNTVGTPGGGRRSRRATTTASGGGRGRLGTADENPLLSLQLGGQDAVNNGGRSDAHKSVRPDQGSGGLTPGTFNHLMGMLGGNNSQASPFAPQQAQQTQTQPGNQQSSVSQQQPLTGGGSALLKGANAPGNFGGFGMAHRPHQNDALLNPNPIPFALNFSNEPAPDQSWWDRNGGGMFGSDSFLDEKANAVAHAQLSSRNNDGSSSPFDISAFLTSGLTPGSNMNFNNGMPTGFTPALTASADPLNAAGADIKGGKEPAAGSAGKPALSSGQPSLTPAEHVQTFLRLLERRAIHANDQRHRQRSSSSQQQQQQQQLQSSSSSSKQMITPNAAYSRLAQHPTFLRTDARELEEMIEAIKPASLATVSAQGSSSGAPVEVECDALDQLKSMLDRKQRFGSVSGNVRGGESGGMVSSQQQQQQGAPTATVKMES